MYEQSLASTVNTEVRILALGGLIFLSVFCCKFPQAVLLELRRSSINPK